MKIAAVSEDGVTISQHFGRAPFYMVVTVEDGKIVSREKRDKLGHNQFGGETHDESHTEEHSAGGVDPHGHGFAPAEQDRHFRMAEAIRDCQVLLARGMGSGAYYSMEQVGIRPVITDLANIDEAALAYMAGKLTDHIEKLH